MVKQVLNKIVAIFIIMLLTMGNLLFVANESYAAFEELEEQKSTTSDKNVSFDAYFSVEEKNTHSVTINTTDEAIINFEVNVGEGYLKESQIDLKNPNFEIISIESQSIEGIVNTFEKNKITLNQISSKTKAIISAKIKINHQEMVDIDILGRETNIEFTSNYTNIKGKTSNLNSNIVVRVDFISDAKTIVDTNVEKYMILGNKTVVQTKVTSGIENNVLPIKNTNIKIQVPQINGSIAQDVRVTAINTIATNGTENGNNFTKENYTYDNKIGIVEIMQENLPNNENKISWKNGTDEYIVTFIYEGIQNIANIDLKATNSITTYKDIEVKNEIAKSQEISLNGNNVDFVLEATKDLSKGYMYANSNYETEYQSKWSANITYADFTDTLIFQQNTDKFIRENGKTEYVNSYYKQTKINKANFEKILGTDGQAQIYNEDKLLGVINKDTKLDESGNYVFDFSEQISNIKIQMGKPVSEGKIIIENIKAITATSPYNLNQIKSFKSIENSLVGSSLGQDTQDIKQATNLLETTTKAELQIGKENLSTVITNEDVEIRAVLESDDITDDLYKNPTIEINMPEEIENINIKSANILFTNQMKITKIEIVNNHIIRIGLTGEQTEFITDGNKGITVILNTDLKLRRTATNKQTKVTMKVTNQKMITLENEGISNTNINIVAPTGIIALNSVTNAKTGETATSLESKEEQGSLQRNTASQIAIYTQTVINNTSNTISNAKIIGTIPTNGDKLGSNIDTKFISNINSQEGVSCDIYYSTNIDATSDLNNSQNGWSKEIAEDTKAYLIVINEQIEQGRELNFSYNIEVPENLEYGVNAVSSYKVEYEEGSKISNKIASINGRMAIANADPQTTSQTLSEEATPITLSTGSGPVLEATLEDNTVDGTVYVGQVVTYTVTVTNKGTEDAQNVKVNLEVPEGMVYVIYEVDKEDGNKYLVEKQDENINILIEKININEIQKISINLKAKNVKEKIEINATVSANYGNIQSNKIENKIVSSNIGLDIEYVNGEAAIGEEIQYLVTINNNSKEKRENLNIEVILPEKAEFKNLKIKDIFSDKTSESEIKEENNKINVKIKQMESTDIIYIYITFIPTGEIKNEGIYATLNTINIKNQTSTIKIINVLKPNGIVEIKSQKDEGYVQVGDILDYNISIQNTGNTEVFETIEIDLPNNFYIIEKTLDGQEIVEPFYQIDKSTNKVRIYKEIQGKEQIRICLKVEIDPDLEISQDKNVQVKIKMEKMKIEKTFNYIIEKNIEKKPNPDNPEDPEEPPESKTYKISGVAWLDLNKNGKIDNTETKLSEIPVKAINREGKTIAKGETSKDGKYTLEKLPQGEYTVIFEYDTSKYLLTTYQAQDVEESINSNVIKAKLNGKDVATTNTIKITDRSIANINIGLVEGSNFDLSLKKKVTQIAMVNSKRTLTLDYDTQLAKMDLDYQYIDSTNLAVEYEITVTNEGDIPGYATKIVDYLPKEFDFRADLNKDWYTSGKNIETKALENTLINPGESASVTLVLTKSMTENDNGIVCNTAEIAETYNEFSELDSDSQPANNKEGEDDISSANVILGLRTGGPITYITLTLSIMVLICIGAYEINKRVLKI